MTQAAYPKFEVRVGVFTIIAVIMLVYGWTWLKSFSLLHPPQRFTVQFHDVAGLNKNATVNINGVRVGVVENIELKAKGQVLVHPKITAPNVVVSHGSVVTIQTLGLIGAKYLEVTLPTQSPGAPAPTPLTENDVVIGEDPVRIELAANEVATYARQLVGAMKGKKVGVNIAQTMENLNRMSSKFDSSMGQFGHIAGDVSAASKQIAGFSRKAEITAGSATTFFDRGTQTLATINGLALDMSATDKKLDKLLNKPLVSSDLKEVIEKARQTSVEVGAAIKQLNATLSNNDTRRDLVMMMDKLSQSAGSIAHSVNVIDDLARDKDLRGDLKSMITQAREALDKANSIMNEPGFGQDMRDTMTKVRTAAANVDVAARQIQVFLGRGHPLLHLFVGRGVKPEALSPETTIPSGGATAPGSAEKLRGSADVPSALRTGELGKDSN